MAEVIGSGGGRSASRSGGCRRWGWSGRGGTPWRHEARVGVEGVQGRLEESSTGRFS
jgi:hypothetical protein